MDKLSEITYAAFSDELMKIAMQRGMSEEEARKLAYAWNPFKGTLKSLGSSVKEMATGSKHKAYLAAMREAAGKAPLPPKDSILKQLNPLHGMGRDLGKSLKSAPGQLREQLV